MPRRSVMLLAIVAAWGALSLSCLPSSAATALQKYERVIGRSAQTPDKLPDKPKAACVCTDPIFPQLVGKAGLLRRYLDTDRRLTVDCVVYEFSTAGDATGFTACYEFELLPK